MTLLQNDPITQLAFSVHENKGVYALLLGSGLSRSAEIPTGWEITLDLVRRIAITQGVEGQADWAQWYRDTTGKEPNYSTLLEEIASSPAERRAILHRYIEPNEDDREHGRKLPTKAHHAIAQLVRSGHLRVIVTTNFDRLMEHALQAAGVEPTVVSSVDALAGAEPLTHSTCYLLKLHGDYKDARILNTDQELSAYPDPYNQLLDRILDEYGLVVCGWSGEWDHALRAAFLRAPNRRYPVYWAACGPLGTGAKDLIAHRHANTVPIEGADPFFLTLQQRVETLALSQRQNPRSIELLVSSTKRYLAKPEYRIQLDELLSQEFEHLLMQLDDSSFSTSNGWNQPEFRLRVQRYEAITEALARMVGVLGRWGDGSELPLVLEMLKDIHRQAPKTQGQTFAVWLNLHSYPAVLLFTAYGIALTRSQRWQTLHELLTAPWILVNGESNTVASALLLWSWDGGENDLWKQLEGLDRHKTALSDHLLSVLSAWKSSFAGAPSEFEVVFARFEILAALAYLEQASEPSLEQALASNPQDILARMPVGRAGWHHTSATTLIQELQSEATKAALLEAGFANRSRRFLELFVINFRRYMGFMARPY